MISKVLCLKLACDFLLKMLDVCTMSAMSTETESLLNFS